jgi:HD-GYP domain-containing protein (c-di-GMP phosphodiesterase class II)
MLKTLKIEITELDVGMFVSSLDRPWLGTPFLTQGFYIESVGDISRLGEFCQFVFVDSRRSRQKSLAPARVTPEQNSKSTAGTKKRAHDRPRIALQDIFVGRVLKPYQDESAWEEEHPRARNALNALIGDIDKIYQQVVEGAKLNVVRLRKSIEPIVDSISNNPDACLWVARLKQHDEYTYQHSLGAAIWSVSLGRQLGLPKRDLRSLAMGCMLMDVGKLRLPPALLQAGRELTQEELAEVASHVSHGLEILEECGILNQDVVDIVAHHHERYDGSGYPQGLSENDIPPFARIAAIVDTYDAITSSRHYAPAVSPADAIKLLYKSRDEEFQAELVEAFIQAVGIYPAGTLVELTSGEVGVVVAEYRTRRLRPKVMLLLDSRKNKLRRSKVLDLQEVSDREGTASLSIKKSLEPAAYGIDLSGVALKVGIK